MVRSSHYSRLKTPKALRHKVKGDDSTIQDFELLIESLDEHGRGLAKGSNNQLHKVPFALSGERCRVRGHLNDDILELDSVIERSESRQEPPCPQFGRCGGCQLQHMTYDAQLQFKRERLWQGLSTLTSVPPAAAASKRKSKPKLGQKPSGKKNSKQSDGPVLQSDLLSIDDISVLTSSELTYRRRARLGINAKGQLGFRKASSNDTLGLASCPILTAPLQDIMHALNALFGRFSGINWRAHLGHVELLDVEPGPLILLRVVKPIPHDAFEQMQVIVQEKNWRLAVQSSKDGDYRAVIGELDSFYRVNKQSIAFDPGRFIQVNSEMNEAMVAQAMQWLQLQGDEQVLDLFCGVGNFTLSLAQQAGKVLGIELSENMVDMAQENAHRQQLENVEFLAANLDLGEDLLPSYETLAVSNPDVILLDPPRAGAGGFIPTLLELSPERILYISCHQGSLLRDLRRLGKASFRLEKLSLMDMFPNTEHVECMALLSKG